jgi:HSF-type DNA-binding
MCRSSNSNYKLQATIDVSNLGVKSSQVVDSLASSLSTAFQNVNKSKGTSTDASTSRKQHHQHIVVEHDYHDHANENVFVDERPARGGVTTPFPIRLHQMLDQLTLDGHADVISWQPHGRCFVIRKPKEFKELLPVYFNLSKMSSFQRQLNLYGFQRLTRGSDKNGKSSMVAVFFLLVVAHPILMDCQHSSLFLLKGYYHEYFLRGRTALSHKLQRTKVKGTGVRARSNPTTEPHLWEMPWVGTDTSTASHDVRQSDNGSVSSHADDFESPKASPVLSLKKKTSLNHSSAFFLPPSTGSSSMPAAATIEPAPLMIPSSSRQHPILQQEPRDSGCATGGNEHDKMMSFGGKRFYYLDPMEIMKEAQLRTRQIEACRRNDMEAFMTSLELDSLYSEIDEEAMDSDDTFMDMLERIIE